MTRMKSVVIVAVLASLGTPAIVHATANGEQRNDSQQSAQDKSAHAYDQWMVQDFRWGGVV